MVGVSRDSVVCYDIIFSSLDQEPREITSPDQYVSVNFASVNFVSNMSSIFWSVLINPSCPMSSVFWSVLILHVLRDQQFDLC